MISAYDPSRLKHITIDKKELADFFQKHNPDQDSLGKLCIDPVLNHFDQWKKKINKRYLNIFNQFISENAL